MLFTETLEKEDEEQCYDVDISLILSDNDLGSYKYKYDLVEYEDLNEIDEFLEYCIETLGQEDENVE